MVKIIDHRCCFTGHRPEKLFYPQEEIQKALKLEIQAAIAAGSTVFISGVSRGVDLWAGEQIIKEKEKNPDLKLICAVPFLGFETAWESSWIALYNQVVAKADFMKIFFPSYNPTAFQMRNHWMVDRCKRIIAVYNGSCGGTANTLAYARRRKRTICLLPG